MSRFVDECRKEWKRLGVPEGVAEEMAADLAADLAEAEAEGASAEHVLGNGAFDARTFAASWAASRGLARPRATVLATARSPWTVAAGGVTSAFLALVGIALLARGHGSVAVAAKQSIVPSPPPFVGPRGFRVVIPPDRALVLVNDHLQILGFFLLGIGLVGLGLALWLWRRWKPSFARRHGGMEDNVALPTYL